MDALMLEAKAFIDKARCQLSRTTSTASVHFLKQSQRRAQPLLLTAVDAERHKKLAATLRILQATRGTVDDALEAHGAELDGRGSAASAVASSIARLQNFKRKAAEAGLLDHALLATQPAASPLEQDMLAIEALRATASGGWADTDCLEAVVRDLRTLEAGADIQARMRMETAALAEAHGWSEGNFAYGSTPLSSWITVWSCPALVAAADATRCGRGGGCVVWGSSLGWLCFYTALCFGVPCVGVEILPCLVAAAESVRQACCAHKVSFAHGDMLASSLEGVSVVVLASQCWDRALRRRAGDKLTAELSSGAIVIDYVPALREWEAFGEPMWSCSAPTSWNPRQQFFVFVKK